MFVPTYPLQESMNAAPGAPAIDDVQDDITLEDLGNPMLLRYPVNLKPSHDFFQETSVRELLEAPAVKENTNSVLLAVQTVK